MHITCMHFSLHTTPGHERSIKQLDIIVQDKLKRNISNEEKKEIESVNYDRAFKSRTCVLLQQFTALGGAVTALCRCIPSNHTVVLGDEINRSNDKH